MARAEAQGQGRSPSSRVSAVIARDREVIRLQGCLRTTATSCGFNKKPYVNSNVAPHVDDPMTAMTREDGDLLLLAQFPFSVDLTHSVWSLGGRIRVCITTQYCSAFSRNRVSCSAVAWGARMSNRIRMLSKPTGTFFDRPNVPWRSMSPSTVTAIRSVG